MHDLTDAFFRRLSALELHEIKEHNFFSSGGSGYFENPTSDLLALFMGSQPGVPPWLLKALMTSIGVSAGIDDLDITSLEVTREACTPEGKYLDLVIYHQDFIIGIEHKTISAINNPFEIYKDYLDSLVDNGQDVYCCILAPDNLRCLPVAGWPLVRYSRLVSTARSRSGNDQMGVPFSKWHVFYSEFLNHLHDLSGVDGSMVMNQESQDFVNEHFSLLLKAKDLLKEFETAMLEEGKKTLSELLPDAHITHKINNWEGDYKAIYLAPDCWGKNDTSLTLIYSPEEDGHIRYYINAWINLADYPDLATLHRWVLDNLESPTFLPSAYKDDAEIVLKGKGLRLSIGTDAGTLDATKAL
jgi:hypothetical protein